MRVDREISRRAITGEENMNKAELGVRLATEFSLTRATAGRMVGAVFAAIGESLANEDPSPSPVSGPSASGHARLARGAIRVPARRSRSPSLAPTTTTTRAGARALNRCCLRFHARTTATVHPSVQRPPGS